MLHTLTNIRDGPAGAAIVDGGADVSLGRLRSDVGATRRVDYKAVRNDEGVVPKQSTPGIVGIHTSAG